MFLFIAVYPVRERHIRNVILRKMAEDESVPDITLQKQVIQTQIGKTMDKGQTWYYYNLILLHISLRYCVLVDMLQCLLFSFETVTYNFS
jgi:hypothetical protein